MLIIYKLAIKVDIKIQKKELQLNKKRNVCCAKGLFKKISGNTTVVSVNLGLIFMNK